MSFKRKMLREMIRRGLPKKHHEKVHRLTQVGMGKGFEYVTETIRAIRENDEDNELRTKTVLNK